MHTRLHAGDEGEVRRMMKMFIMSSWMKKDNLRGSGLFIYIQHMFKFLGSYVLAKVLGGGLMVAALIYFIL